MDTNHHSVEPASGGKPGWVVLNGTRMVMHCTDRDEAETIAEELSLQAFSNSLLRMPEKRLPALRAPFG
jgi:hypothetical protein